VVVVGVFSNNHQTGWSAKENKKLHIMLSKPKKLISKVTPSQHLYIYIYIYILFIYLFILIIFILFLKNCGVKFCQNVKIKREYFVTIF